MLLYIQGGEIFEKAPINIVQFVTPQETTGNKQS